jgi:integrase
MARAKVTIRFRKNRGVWEVDYRDIDGVRRRPLFSTEEAAHEFATEVFRRVGQVLPVIQDREITLREYATRWLAMVEADRAPNTHRSYAERLKRHVLPALGHLKLRLIHRAHIKAFLAEKRRQGHSKNSVRLMKAPLSALLSEAVDDGLIPVNPALQLGRRLGGRANKLTQSERVQRIRPMTWEQRQAFLDAAAAERRHFALFATLVYAGLRPGEGFALRPGDLDFPQRLIRVERAWSLRREKDTKTHDQRAVEMSRNLTRILLEHLTWLKAEAFRCGWGQPEWLFPSEVGRPMDETKVGRVFRGVLRRAGLPAFRVYDLRHTFASLLLARNAPITYVAAQLGHANPATTLRFYARWIPSRGQRWVEVLDRRDDLKATAEALLSDLEPKVEPNRPFGGRDDVEVIDSEWSRGRDLNPRPADYESAALPLSYPGLGQHYKALTRRWPVVAVGPVVKSVGEFSAIRSTASALWVGLRCV